MPAPVGQQSADHDPEELVVAGEPGSFARGTREDHQLLAQEQVLGDHVAPVPEGAADQVDQQQQVIKQRADMMPAGIEASIRTSAPR